jgi:spermidine synthase
MGLLLLFGTPVIEFVYTSVGGGSIWVRAVVAGVCLLPPTMMMGATLPAVARFVKTTPEGVSWMGFFYGGNIGGAVVGALAAGFLLLRLFDMTVATFVAAFLNVIVSLFALMLAGAASYEPVETTDDETIKRSAGARTVYLVIAMSGMTALAAQVLWTRQLSLLFGATTYTFSLILGVFLVGLGIGSSVGAAMSRGRINPRVALGWCQMLICFALAWAAYMMTESLPFWPINPSITSDPWFNFQLDLVRCFWVVLPGALLWGASFPLALAAIAAPGQDPGRLVGGVYAANTVGAIVGSMGAGLLLVVWPGTQTSQGVLIFLSAIAALTLLAPAAAGETKDGRIRLTATVVLLMATGAAGWLSRFGVPEVPDLLVAYGRYAATWVGYGGNVIYKGEGRNAFVAVTELPSGVRNYHNAGKIQASSEPQDMSLQRMLGHLTHLIPDEPTDALVIGFGAGVTAGSVAIGPGVENLTIAEIEPLVPQVVSTYFSEYNYDVANSSKVNIHLDDARHYLLTTDQKFDAITSDPLDPWVKGAATLYTEEFFGVVREHLNPGGVVTLFVQLYESNTDAVKSEIGTFFEAFPNAVIWGNTNQGEGYDLVVMGQLEPIRIDVDAMEAKLQSPEYAQVAQSLREIGIYSAIDLFSNYAGTPADLAGWLADAQINRDRNLRLQYLAGLGFNLYNAGPIYASMVANARYPEEMFTGSPETLQELRAAIARKQGR